MKTGLITSESYKNHNTGNGHPEKIDRVAVIIDNFKKLDNKNIIWKKPAKFDQSLLIHTHSATYINHVDKSFPKQAVHSSLLPQSPYRRFQIQFLPFGKNPPFLIFLHDSLLLLMNRVCSKSQYAELRNYDRSGA